YHWTERITGVALAFFGVASAIVSAFLVGRFVGRLGERGALVPGLVGGSCAFAIFGLAPSTLWFMTAVPVDAVLGLATPTMQSLMSERIDASAQGRLQGALSSMRGVTGMIGPIVFTQIFAGSIREGARVPGATFLVAAGLVVVSLVTVLGASRRRRN